MSKEKIIGLSVIGVLASTLVGVTTWRMMGGRATSPEPAALAGDGKAEAAGEDNSTGPTVLASATSSNDELAARLSGKTKIKGGWETANAEWVLMVRARDLPREALHQDPGLRVDARQAGAVGRDRLQDA